MDIDPGRVAEMVKAYRMIPWNWKASLISGAVRASIFLLFTRAYGWHAATLAAVVEAVYSAGTAGVLAGMVQVVRNWRPIWWTALVIIGLIPLGSQASDFAVHRLLHTPNLLACMPYSVACSAAGMTFTWFSMDRGTFLVGDAGSSLFQDLHRMPQLLVEFLRAPVDWTLGQVRLSAKKFDRKPS